MRSFRCLLFVPCLLWFWSQNGAAAEPPRQVFVVPNFHPASCGWLTDWSTERNYCANTYFDHLDRVRDDPNYNFALSECNNLIAMMNFSPQRFAELKQRVKQGRVELCNAFFLEPTINLSGGEALVKCGVEGLRWQEAMLGVRPRMAWMIDVTGMHEQMAQITAGLGLDALVYCRHNPTGYAMHWLVSPDGTRTLAVAPGPYLDWQTPFKTTAPLTEKQLNELRADLLFRASPTPPTSEEIQNRYEPSGGEPRRAPVGAPLLILAGSGDYSLAPLRKAYPTEFLEQLRRLAPEFDVRFSTPSRYLDAVLPGIKVDKIRLPEMRGGSVFNYNSFWIQNPRVKAWYRRCEQLLQSAEMLATAASLRGSFKYPVQPLYHAWLQVLLNMDRNTLWGAAGGMVFEHARSWDVRDRFESVERTSRAVLVQAARALAGEGKTPVAFNSLNWHRNDPVRLPMAVGAACQQLPGSTDTLCCVELPSVGLAGVKAAEAVRPKEITLPPVIETRYYRLRINGSTGALVSLKLKSSDQELLSGPANVIVAEQPKTKLGNPGDMMVDRPDRVRQTDSDQSKSTLTVTTGPLATVVQAESAFVGGGKLRRLTIIYHDYPRIDFETELNDLPDRTVVVAEFPLAPPVREVRRGIPYGFSHAAWPPEDGTTNSNPAKVRCPGYDPQANSATGAKRSSALTGVAKGIAPAVRWSHYQMADAGVALLDQGLTGREIVDNTPVIYLYNATKEYVGYPNSWLSGSGRHVLRYAIVAHAGDFTAARIPQMAWEFNNPPVVIADCAPAEPVSFVQTSDNVIVEALRREGGQIELRLAECLGQIGNADVTLSLPHGDAALTDLVGGHRKSLDNGPSYRFAVRPQQIVTMRFNTDAAVPDIEPLTAWDELVPEKKREALRRYLPDVKGHPPAGGQ